MDNDPRIIKALETAGIDYDPDSLAPGKSFRDIGIDSLDVMGLFLAIEEAHGIKFSEDEANAIGTPVDLITMLDRKLSGDP